MQVLLDLVPLFLKLHPNLLSSLQVEMGYVQEQFLVLVNERQFWVGYPPTLLNHSTLQLVVLYLRNGLLWFLLRFLFLFLLGLPLLFLHYLPYLLGCTLFHL